MGKRSRIPNSYGTACTLTITRPDGSEFVALFDEEDRDIVESHHWTLDRDLYAYCKTPSVKGQNVRTIYLARLLLGLTHGDGKYADHANGNHLDNRRDNLRVTTNAWNCANQPIVNHRGTSRFRGVSWHKRMGSWRAQVRMNYRSHTVGHYPTEEEAAAAVARFREHHGLPAGY